jgi:hypothetical protein
MRLDKRQEKPIAHNFDRKFMRYILTILCCLLLVATGTLHAQLDHFAVLTTAGDTIIPPQTAGVLFFVEILAKDSMNNTDTTFNDTVTIGSSGNLASGGGVSAAFINGVLASTPVKFSNTGTFTITASYSAGSITGSSKSFPVQAGSPAELVFVQGPTNVRSGISISPAMTVQVRDSLGNAVPTSDRKSVV